MLLPDYRYRQTHKYMFGIVDALECSADSSEWTEWGPCSESCGLGFRQRYCREESPSGEVKATKDTEKCQVQSNQCETMEGTKSA